MIYVIINNEETACLGKNIYMSVIEIEQGIYQIGTCDTLIMATHFDNTVDAEQAYYALLNHGYKNCHVVVDTGVCAQTWKG